MIIKHKLSIIFFLNIVTNTIFAQTGSLDLSFGNNGIVTTSISSGSDAGNSVAVQSDGKIIVAGRTRNGNNDDFALIRYNSNGSLDTSFDNDGIVITTISTMNDGINAVKILNDGKILVAGYAGNANATNLDFALVRYNTDGSLDTTFGINGKVITAILSSTDVANCLAIQNDGKIVVAGYSFGGSDNVYSLARFDSNGSLDTTFNSTGTIVTNIGSGSDKINAIAIQSDNKIVVAGYSYDFSFGISYSNFSLARYNTNGSLDTTFDTDGKVITSNSSNNDEIQGITIQPDGKIIAAGFISNTANSNFGIVRYNINGSLDTTFGTNGVVNQPIGISNEIGTCVVLQSDNKILVGGYSYDSTTIDNFALLRLNTDGSVDNSFGNNGTTTTPIGVGGVTDISTCIALDNNGNIILAGYTGTYSLANYDFAVVRYNNNILGINSNNISNSEVKIFPNPINKTATIKSNIFLKDATLNIFDTLGQLVKQVKNISGNSIEFNRDNLKNGTYLIQLLDINNEIINLKIIIN